MEQTGQAKMAGAAGLAAILRHIWVPSKKAATVHAGSAQEEDLHR